MIQFQSILITMLGTMIMNNNSSSSECEELSESSENPPEYDLQQLDPLVKYNNEDTSDSEESDS